MRATTLSRAIWNSVADLAKRSQNPREVYFSEVTKADPANGLIWAKDFGDVAIPLVAFRSAFAYYDTVPTGVSGLTVTTEVVRREDVKHKNANFETHTICPQPGDVVVIIDPWGAKRFPMAVGVLPSPPGVWVEA